MKLFSKFLIILVSLNLILYPFYPVVAIGRVYAQEEWSGEESGGEEAPAGEPEPAWKPKPEPVVEPEPAYIPWWEDYPVAETVPPEVPQEQVDACLMYGEGCQYTVPGYVQPTPEPFFWPTPEPTPEPTVYFEPTPEPVMFSPEPAYTPAPIESTPAPFYEPTPEPTPQSIPQQQIDSCLQYGEGCGVVSQPITDASSQSQATTDYWQSYDQTYATTTNNEYIAAEVRQEDAGGGVVQDIVAAPEVAAETSGNWWDGATSFIGTQAGNFGQFITSPFAARTGYAENLYKEAEKTEQAVENQNKQQEDALNAAINAPVSQKLAGLKEQFGLQDMSDDQAIPIIKEAYSLRGLDFNPEDGSAQKSPDDSYTPSNYSIDFTQAKKPAVTDQQVESCQQYGEGCTGLYWTPEELAQRRQQSQDVIDAIKEFTLNFSQIYSTGGKLLENINTVNEMQPLYDETGMRARTQARLSTYTGSEKVPDYFTNGAFVNGTITPEEVEDDMKANPDLGNPEKNAVRAQLLELAKEKEERGKEITLEVSAAMLMGSVGGSNAVPILKKAGEKIAAKAAGRVTEGIVVKETVAERAIAEADQALNSGSQALNKAAATIEEVSQASSLEKAQQAATQVKQQVEEALSKLADTRRAIDRFEAESGDSRLAELARQNIDQVERQIKDAQDYVTAINENSDLAEIQGKLSSAQYRLDGGIRSVSDVEGVVGSAKSAERGIVDVAAGQGNRLIETQNFAQRVEENTGGAITPEGYRFRIENDGEVYISGKDQPLTFWATVDGSDQVPPVIKNINLVQQKDQGLGRGLVKAWEESVAAKGEQFVGITNVNPEAFGFWEKMGYEPVVQGDRYFWAKPLTEEAKQSMEEAKAAALRASGTSESTVTAFTRNMNASLESKAVERATQSAEGTVEKTVTQNLADLAAGKSVSKGELEPVFVGAARVEGTAADTGLGVLVDDTTREFDLENLYPPEAIQRARNFLEGKVAGPISEKNVRYIVDAFDSGLPEKELASKIEQINSYHDYMRDSLRQGKSWSEALDEAPPEMWEVNRAGRYNYSNFEDVAGNSTLMSLDSLLTKEANTKKLKPVLEDSKDILDALKRYATDHGVDPASLPDPELMLDPQNIFVIDKQTMTNLGGKSNWAGMYDGVEDEIFIEYSYRDHVTVCSHEVLHRCFYNGLEGPFGSDIEKQVLAAKVGGETIKQDYWSNYRKFIEGLNEWTTQTGQKLAGKEAEYVAYQPQVKAFDQIEKKLAKELKSADKAKAVLIEAGMGGKPEVIFQTLGSGDEAQGAKMVADLLDKVPDTKTNVVNVSRVTTKNDIARAVAAMTAVVAGEVGAVMTVNQVTGGQIDEGARNIRDTLFPPTVNSTPEPTPIQMRLEVPQQTPQPTPESGLLPWLISNAWAAENKPTEAPVVDTETFEYLVKQQLIKNALFEDGKVSSDYVKQVLALDILQPEVQKRTDGYVLTTGKAGTVEGPVEKTTYKVTVNPLPGVDMEVPAVVDLTKDLSAIVAVKIKKGSGQVEKVASRPGWDLMGTVYADEAKDASDSASVKVILTGEQRQVLPWAGVDVTLEKVGQEKTIHLSAGWNLMTLTALPGKPLTASAMLDLIDSQDGQATAVSTLVDGSWKTFVSRGSIDYSTEDFLIEPGKAYFVKALKPSKFSFTGQNFVEPIKLKLSSGWNAVGLPVLSKKTEAQYKASELLDDLNTQQAGAETVAQWDSGLWDTFVKKNQEQYGNDFRLESTRGYILKVGKEMELSP